MSYFLSEENVNPFTEESLKEASGITGDTLRQFSEIKKLSSGFSIDMEILRKIAMVYEIDNASFNDAMALIDIAYRIGFLQGCSESFIKAERRAMFKELEQELEV